MGRGRDPTAPAHPWEGIPGEDLGRLFFFGGFVNWTIHTDAAPDQDHASGALLVAEAGGKVSNGRSMPLDFGLWRTPGENFGVVVAHGDIHQQVIEAIAQENENKPSL